MRIALLIATLSLTCSAAAVLAQDQYTIGVGYSAGGSYDVNARLVAEFLPAHLAGNPSIVVENIPGAAVCDAGG